MTGRPLGISSKRATNHDRLYLTGRLGLHAINDDDASWPMKMSNIASL
jgi:hypothetical protein